MKTDYLYLNEELCWSWHY